MGYNHYVSAGLTPLAGDNTGELAMNIATFAEELAEATGLDGRELQAATYFLCAIWADVNGDKEAGDYFARRAKEYA